MKTINVIRSQDPDGRGIIRVPLHGRDYATLYDTDFQMLVDLGLSLAWNRLPSGYVTAPASRAAGKSVMVARVLLDARAGQTVRYVDGDKLNLRSSNILLFDIGEAQRRDRDWITPSETRRPVKVDYKDAA